MKKKKYNRFASITYKKGGEKQDWISQKISLLEDEDNGRSHAENVAIALSMAETMFQVGGQVVDPLLRQKNVEREPTSNLKPIFNIQHGVSSDKYGRGSYLYYKDPADPTFDYTTDRDFITQEAWTRTALPSPAVQEYQKRQALKANPIQYQMGGEKPLNLNKSLDMMLLEQQKYPDLNNALADISKSDPQQFLPQDIQNQQIKSDIQVTDGSSLLTEPQTEQDKALIAQSTAPNFGSNTQDPYQFINPYGGTDVTASANYLGESIGKGDTLGIVAGGLATALPLGRAVFSGMGRANVEEEAKKNYFDKQKEGLIGTYQSLQDGGQVQPQEQVIQEVVGMLQQGADPQQVLQSLISQGVPEQEATQIIQMIMQQMQTQQPPTQEQPMMKNGGTYLDQIKGKRIVDYKYNEKTGNYDVQFE